MKLHLGCGERYIPNWTHIDICGGGHIDHHTFVHDLEQFEYHREVIYSHSLGISGIARFSQQISKRFWSLFSIEGRYTQAFFFEGGGQDLSEYQYSNGQIRLSIGIGRD